MEPPGCGTDHPTDGVRERKGQPQVDPDVVAAEQDAFSPRPSAPAARPSTGGREVELVITAFSSFGRVAHVRRYLQGLAPVASARILDYAPGTVRFLLEIEPGTPSHTLVVPGTDLLDADGPRVRLQERNGRR